MINLESPQAPDAAYIRTMFDRMARRYDAFTALIGLGQTHRWRAHALEPLRPGMRVLDLGCGTGDLALAAAARVGPSGEVVGLDFSGDMLAVAAHKARVRRTPAWGPVRWVQVRAEDLPLPDAPFDMVVSGFVLRNLYANIDAILAGMKASLRPGGRVRLLDLTEPKRAPLRAVFRAYLLGPVGLYGALLFGRDYPVPYLPDSAQRFWKADEFVAALRRAGFSDVTRRSFLFGTVTLYDAARP